MIENDEGPGARMPSGNRWAFCDPAVEKRFNDLTRARFLNGLSLSDLATDFARSGYSLFLAGGCVRRLVLKERIVSTDVDLVGTAPLLQVEAPLRRICADHPECALTVHRHLGVLTLEAKAKNGTLTGLDYVVMRAGGAYENRRTLHGTGFEGSPLVLGPDPVYHARTLDFTINTLLYDFASGQIWDPTGQGMFDAQKGILRLPSMAFVESNAKLFLRAIKFLIADPKLQLDPPTISGLQRNASKFEAQFLARLSGIMPKFENIEACASWRDALVQALTRLGREAQVTQVPNPVELYARARSQD